MQYEQRPMWFRVIRARRRDNRTPDRFFELELLGYGHYEIEVPLPQLFMTAFGSSNQPYKKYQCGSSLPLTVSCV